MVGTYEEPLGAGFGVCIPDLELAHALVVDEREEVCRYPFLGRILLIFGGCFFNIVRRQFEVQFKSSFP
jgi:hypothetical protein